MFDFNYFIYTDDENLTSKAAEERSNLVKELKGLSVKQCTKQSYVSPLMMREQVHGVWKNHPNLMSVLFGDKTSGSNLPGEMFFLDVISVPPSRFRPVS